MYIVQATAIYIKRILNRLLILKMSRNSLFVTRQNIADLYVSIFCTRYLETRLLLTIKAQITIFRVTEKQNLYSHLIKFKNKSTYIKKLVVKVHLKQKKNSLAVFITINNNIKPTRKNTVRSSLR